MWDIRKMLISTPGIGLALALVQGVLTRETRPDPKLGALRSARPPSKPPSKRDLHRQAVALNKKTRGSR